MQLDTLYGPLDVPEWPEDLILDALRRTGEWAATEAAIFAQVIPNDTMLWDCGAFVGSFSLGVAKLRRLSGVLAVEANPALAPFLKSNLSRLAPCPATVVSGGVAMQDGCITARPPKNAGVDNHGGESYEFTGPAPAENGALICHTLKTLRSRHGDYTALKLDIEGMESEALKGDYRFIRENKPVVWVECNESIDSLEILAVLKSLGYDPVYIAFPAFRADNYLDTPDIRFPMAYEAALLAAPATVIDCIDWAHNIFAQTIRRPIATQLDLRKALFDTPRWGRAEWAELSKPELIARLTRALSDQTLPDFLA